MPTAGSRRLTSAAWQRLCNTSRAYATGINGSLASVRFAPLRSSGRGRTPAGQRRAASTTAVPDTSHPMWVFSSLFGAAAAYLGLHSSGGSDQRQETEEQACEIHESVEAALGLLQTARAEYLRHAEAFHVVGLLESAEGAVKQASRQLSSSPHRDQVQAALKAKFKVTPSVLSNLQAHISYHRAAVALRSNDAEKAHFEFAPSELDQAIGRYADVHSGENLFETFWQVRAANNAAVVEFGRGNDAKALETMQMAARSTREWLQRSARAAVLDPRMLADISRGAEVLSAHRACGPLSDKLLRLVNMGADDAVDVLHLLPALGAVNTTYTKSKRLQRDDTRTQAGLEVAAEYLERVKLMMRKHYTSRANCLLIACAPGSTALNCETQPGMPPRWNGERLMELLEAAVQEPWDLEDNGSGGVIAAEMAAGTGGLSLYARLDREWLAREGGARLLAAMGLALTELVAARAVSESARADVLSVADKLTAVAKDRHKHERPQLPDLHTCIAALARARYVHISDEGGSSAALKELTMPASGTRASNSVVQWSTQQQASAKQLAGEALSSLLKASTTIPPRTARWQVSVLTYAQQLQRQSGKPQDPSIASSLRFAAQHFDAAHPVRRCAETSSALPDRVSLVVADEERVRALLARVKAWAALLERDLTW